MVSPRKVGTFLMGIVAWMACLAPLAPGQVKEKEFRIGMVRTLFTDVPAPIISFITQPFGSLVKEFTGLKGTMVQGGDPLALAQDLNDGKVDLAVFHGIEFGWAQQKFPELRPLMVAINKHKHLQAHIITSKDNPVEKLADLKGQEIAVPRRSKEHCRMFLEKQCRDVGQAGTADFFKKIVTPANMEAAIDDVCLGKVPAAVLDTVSLEFYNNLKPGCFARLKIISKSEIFPAAVIAYKNGAIDQNDLNRFRDGMLSANKDRKGQEMMNMFMITSFEPVPADYAQVMTNILKTYPGPNGVPTSTPVIGQ